MKKANVTKVAFLLAAGFLTSCVNDNLEEASTHETAGSGQLISFSTSNVATRATLATSVADFKVYAYTGSTTYINGEDYTNGDEGYTGNEYYWPTDGSLDFMAYSPMNAAGLTYSDKSITYTVPTTGQIDLLVSPLATKSKGESGTVNLAFQHVLSQVTFMARIDATANYQVTVNSITLKDVKKTGKLTEAGTGLTAEGDGTADYTLTASPAVVLETAASVIKAGEDDNLLVVPQTFGGDDTTAKLVANITIKDKDGLAEIKTKNVYLSLKGLTWAAGKKQVYTMIFGDTDTSHGGSGTGLGTDENGTPETIGTVVGFTTSVERWGEGETKELTF